MDCAEPENIDWPLCDEYVKALGFHVAVIAGALHSWRIAQYDVILQGRDFDIRVKAVLNAVCSLMRLETRTCLKVTQYCDYERCGFCICVHMT